MEEYNKTLIKIFELEKCCLETSSKKYQDLLKDYIKVLENTTLSINKLELFSTNETLEDLQTNYLKLLLIPAFLGYLTNKLINEDRKKLIEMSKTYFIDFLNRLNSYEIINVDTNKLLEKQEEEFFPKSQPSLEQMTKERNEKIRMYNESKELDEKIEKLNYILKNEDDSKLDDEIVRDFYLTLLKRWKNKILDEIKSLSMEEIMLKHRNNTKDKSISIKPKSSKTDFKPFIITKTDLQKKVFGLGYPSRPTVTIEEFVNQKIDEGSLSVTTEAYKNSLQKWAEDPEEKIKEDEKEQEEKENLEEKDDEANLKKQRDWDDWKDDNKRGSGNRHNMG